MKIIIVFMTLFFINGCSSSYFFYSPSKSMQNTVQQHPAAVTSEYLHSQSGNQLYLQYHRTQLSRRGVVIHFHGNRGNISESIEKVLWLLDAGYDLLLVDYSGFGLSTGVPSRENLALDGASIIEYAATIDLTDDEKRILLATSIGSAIAIDGLVLTKLEHRFDLLVIDSGFDSYVELAIDVVADYPLGWFGDGLVRLMLSDENSPIDNITYLQNIPIIIAHCTNDQLIPLERSVHLYVAATTEKQFWAMSGCEHARTFTDEFPLHQQTLIGAMQQISR